MARGKRAQERSPTPGGLEGMARGDLEPYDPEMYANLNTGVLEQYLDERNRRTSFQGPGWRLSRVLAGVLVGTLFALVNVYVGLKIGLIVAGAWYLTWLLGASRGWSPGHLNLAAGAGTGASFVVAGLVFTYPALVLLQGSTSPATSPLLAQARLPSLALLVTASALAGLLGATAFVLYRRLWLVEEPLPYPRFRAFLRLLDLARGLGRRARERVRYGLRAFVAATAGGAVFAALRDAPLAGGRSVLEALAGGSPNVRDGTVGMDPATARFTQLGVELSPLLVAVGWFLRLRTALAFAAGTLFTWLLVVPLAVLLNAPVYVPGVDAFVGLQSLGGDLGTAALAFQGPALLVAAGALVGAGVTALLRASATLRSAARDLLTLPTRWTHSAYERGRGWYEWPPQHLALLLALLILAIPLLFLREGLPTSSGLLLGVVLAVATLLLGAAAVKVLGETSVEPISGTAFVLFAVLFALLRLGGAFPVDALALALVGTTVFGAAVAMAGNVLLDFKNALYVGVRPLHQMKAETLGIVPGLLVGALAALALSHAIADGHLALAAPQARTFAVLGEALAGHRVSLAALTVGLAIGVFAELVTGLGTTFALGMFLPAGAAVPLVLGGALRAWWEQRVLPGRGGDEEARTVHLLDTYMVATGLIVGEALLGILLAAGYVLGWW